MLHIVKQFLGGVSMVVKSELDTLNGGGNDRITTDSNLQKNNEALNIQNSTKEQLSQLSNGIVEHTEKESGNTQAKGAKDTFAGFDTGGVDRKELMSEINRASFEQLLRTHGAKKILDIITVGTDHEKGKITFTDFFGNRNYDKAKNDLESIGY
ncbi:MAG: hypothetical protein GY828_06275, partial [Candidatus Gracilibacteria bacterium]|nr:hypothetical protein [Candidatus Gracilibacteria bacterium]